jgi:Lhr-like helicase
MAQHTPSNEGSANQMPGGERAASAFGMLHPGVQRQLWRMGWKSLRPLQVNTIHAILGGGGHVILSAATASGKTEAAFLPILSRIAQEPRGSVRAMYLGPLKALINDQFGRVEELCTHLEVPVYHWHGDVSAKEKAQLVEQPGGVLLITPESLESLFVNRSQYLSRLFGGLRFVVIDELHSFLDNERDRTGLWTRKGLRRLRGLRLSPMDRMLMDLKLQELEQLAERRKQMEADMQRVYDQWPQAQYVDEVRGIGMVTAVLPPSPRRYRLADDHPLRRDHRRVRPERRMTALGSRH